MSEISLQQLTYLFFITSLHVKPIFSGLPTMSSDVHGEYVMDTKYVLMREVDALHLLGCGFNAYY